MNIESFATKADRLGVLVFLYVIIYAIIALTQEVSFLSIVLLGVGLGGFLVDLFIVLKMSRRIE